MEEEILSHLGIEKEQQLVVPPIEEILEGVFQGKTIQEAAKLDTEMLEGVYHVAFLSYQNNKYKEAMELFNLLVQLNPTEYRYVFGLSACLMELKEYEMAITGFFIATQISEKDAVSFLHITECLIKLEQYKNAQIVAADLIKFAKSTKQVDLIDKGILLLDLIGNQLITQKK